MERGQLFRNLFFSFAQKVLIEFSTDPQGALLLNHANNFKDLRILSTGIYEYSLQPFWLIDNAFLVEINRVLLQISITKSCKRAWSAVSLIFRMMTQVNANLSLNQNSISIRRFDKWSSSILKLVKPTRWYRGCSHDRKIGCRPAETWFGSHNFSGWHGSHRCLLQVWQKVGWGQRLEALGPI